MRVLSRLNFQISWYIKKIALLTQLQHYQTIIPALCDKLSMRFSNSPASKLFRSAMWLLSWLRELKFVELWKPNFGLNFKQDLVEYCTPSYLVYTDLFIENHLYGYIRFAGFSFVLLLLLLLLLRELIVFRVCFA